MSTSDNGDVLVEYIAAKGSDGKFLPFRPYEPPPANPLPWVVVGIVGIGVYINEMRKRPEWKTVA
jgi:hypothetical protein